MKGEKLTYLSEKWLICYHFALIIHKNDVNVTNNL